MGATKQNVDFTNVSEGGLFSKKHMLAGDYLGKITKVEDAVPKDTSDKSKMWLFTVQLKATPSATYPYYCKLQENQLWKVRNLLVAAGINVPKKRVGVDPNKLVGKLVAVSLDEAEYNGRMQSEIGAIFAASELEGDGGVDDVDEDEEEEEEEAPPKKKKKPAPVEDEDEEEEEEEAPPPAKKKKKAPEPAPEEEEEEEEDEEEEPPPPPKKKKKKKPAPVEEDEEEDDEIDIEDL